MASGRRAYRRASRPDPYDRAEVAATWGHLCIYCAEPGDQIEHLTPLSAGGQDVRENVAWACGPCNHDRADKTWADWLTE